MTDISKIFKSPLHYKIILFFHENPSSLDTARGISVWINHEIKEVEGVLEELAGSNILVAHRSEAVTGFAYTQDKDIVNQVHNYFKNNPNLQTG